MADDANASGEDTAVNTGLFNFQSIMEKFYNWEPEEDDTAGQALKNTFMADNVQTVLNNQMAKDLAYTNAEIATGQMTDAAKLELANTSIIMKDEFDYGMQKMGSEYDYQSKFAVDEANRNLNAEAQKGDIQQGQTKLEGEENRLNIQAQGREELEQIGATGDEAVRQVNAQGNVDINKIGAQGQVDKDNINTQGNVDISKIGAQGDEDVRKIDAQGYMDQALTKVKGEQDRFTIIGQGDQDVRKIKTTGDETRKNMSQQTFEDGKTAARQNKYASKLAGMF
jgi:hypothetical protein